MQAGFAEKELSLPVDVGVHYSSDPEHVEQVTLEVARDILRTHKWGVSDYETFVVYTGFGDSGINFTVMLRAEEYFNRFWVKSAFIKALHKRYAQEGINIPFTIRAINLEQEAAAAQLADSAGNRPARATCTQHPNHPRRGTQRTDGLNKNTARCAPAAQRHIRAHSQVW